MKNTGELQYFLGIQVLGGKSVINNGKVNNCQVGMELNGSGSHTLTNVTLENTGCRAAVSPPGVQQNLTSDQSTSVPPAESGSCTANARSCALRKFCTVDIDRDRDTSEGSGPVIGHESRSTASPPVRTRSRAAAPPPREG